MSRPSSVKFSGSVFRNRIETPALFVALALVALIPAAGVLWFMSVAMRNERLAVQQRLTDVYQNHLVLLEREVTASWQRRVDRLQSAARSPAETFMVIVWSDIADSAIIQDRAGNVLYPAATTSPPLTSEESGDWTTARRLEFQQSDFGGAADAYGRIAAAASDVHTTARALQAQAGALLKAGQKEAALVRLTQVATDSTLSGAVNSQGALIAPNTQLLMVKTLGSDLPMGELGQAMLARLIARLNDYEEGTLSPDQRRFLMQEVKALAPQTNFPTLAAEELAAAYLEQNPVLPGESGLQPTGLPGVSRVVVPGDQVVVALFRTERLKRELAGALQTAALPGVHVRLLAPGESAVAAPVAPHAASELLPGWRLTLGFTGEDPFAAASARQTRFYLWTGLAVVLVIALASILAARYVAAQVRLARLKNDLVSTVSHELKTPLASMRALVDTLITDRCRDEAQRREYLLLIAKENIRLSEVIDNFLTFSRLERGKQHFQFEPLAPGQVIADAVGALREKLGSDHCRFEQEVAADLPAIRGDANAMSTVLINLLDNAWKYTDGEKHIRARAFADDRHVCFEVADNGIGFEPSETPRIFDRFYQIDQSLTRRRGGCGLGLGIVDYIVRAHHGAIQVQSAPGKGSTFRVSIPLAEPVA